MYNVALRPNPYFGLKLTLLPIYIVKKVLARPTSNKVTALILNGNNEPTWRRTGRPQALNKDWADSIEISSVNDGKKKTPYNAQRSNSSDVQLLLYYSG
jgi:hypothetical protein